MIPQNDLEVTEKLALLNELSKARRQKEVISLQTDMRWTLDRVGNPFFTPDVSRYSAAGVKQVHYKDFELTEDHKSTILLNYPAKHGILGLQDKTIPEALAELFNLMVIFDPGSDSEAVEYSQLFEDLRNKLYDSGDKRRVGCDKLGFPQSHHKKVHPLDPKNTLVWDCCLSCQENCVVVDKIKEINQKVELKLSKEKAEPKKPKRKETRE